MTTSERKSSKISTFATPTRARGVSFGNHTLVVDLEDGRQISVPIVWFPRLAEAMAAQPQELSNWRLIGGGIGINWPGLDEHVSVENLLANRSELLTYRGGPPEEEPGQTQRSPRGRPRAVRDPRTGRFGAPSATPPPDPIAVALHSGSPRPRSDRQSPAGRGHPHAARKLRAREAPPTRVQVGVVTSKIAGGSVCKLRAWSLDSTSLRHPGSTARVPQCPRC
jgi:Protein of unknown function (DUF2442)